MGFARPPNRQEMNELRGLSYEEAKKRGQLAGTNKEDSDRYLASQEDFDSYKKAALADFDERKNGYAFDDESSALSGTEEGHRQGRVRERYQASEGEREIVRARAKMMPDLTDQAIEDTKKAQAMRLLTRRGRRSTFLASDFASPMRSAVPGVLGGS